MTLEENKALVRRFIDEVFVRGSFDAIDELLADDVERRNWPSQAMARRISRQRSGDLERS